MKAALFVEPFHLDVAEKQLPPLYDDNLLIKINTCGICGTDYHIFSGTALAKKNTVLGHEFSGVIIDKGKNCVNFEIGDKVVIDPNIYCGKCKFCKEGKVNFCVNHKALGVTLDGGFAEYAVIPSSQAYIIPDNLPLSEASFAEPISCCIRGIDRAQIKVGEIVSIIGGGTIGLIMLQLAKISGAAIIIVIEPVEHKRQLAKELGADFVFSPYDNQLVASIKDLTHGGPHLAIECVGKTETAALAIELVIRGGNVVIFGQPQLNSKLEFNLYEAFKNEITIKTSFLNPFTFSRAVELLSNKKIDVSKFPVTEVGFDSLPDILKNGYNSTSLKYQFKN
ncbi:alcohol dehydrogenase catalytic domain-containing protein [Melioribacteraceae bacterium 4301-Me]|uniref:alcohol dehydrogenase catalytic domain-containing protein n=1 Tax=Pyranulibacter aquaticus TaxID=3163344 RepID=UPI00359854E3